MSLVIYHISCSSYYLIATIAIIICSCCNYVTGFGKTCQLHTKKYKYLKLHNSIIQSVISQEDLEAAGLVISIAIQSLAIRLFK